MSEHGESGPLVVVGVDGSDHSVAVLRWAAQQARATQGRLRVVYGWRLPDVPGYVPPRAEFELSGAAEAMVGKLVTEVPHGLPVDVVVEEEPPVRLLLQQTRDAALLVVGSHGTGHPGGKLLGSVAQSCLAQATCPIVVVPVGRG
ncbi:MAG: universal stress protein [Nocardioidaceae bacterium]